MAVTTTPTAIWTAAFAFDKEFEPDEITDNATDLLNLFIRAERGLWAFAARVNPSFFGKTSDVSFSAPGWQRPVDAELVARIENSDGEEVIVVDMDQRAADPARPAVYRWGQIYRSAGNAADPTSGALTFFYSKRPTAPASMASTLDALWEGAEQFNQLLALECAIYLKMRELKSIDDLVRQRNYWANLFVAFLEHETANLVRNYDIVKRINTETRVPITSLLAGALPVAA